MCLLCSKKEERKKERDTYEVKGGIGIEYMGKSILWFGEKYMH